MNILVIGGAGYIGSHVVDSLIKEKHSVVVFDNLSSGYKENLPKNVDLIVGDILNKIDLETAFSKKKFDVVMHFAALKNAGESMTKMESYYITNVVGTLNILHTMVKFNVDNIVFSSSAAVYGNPKYNPIDESHPLHPENFYGFTKLECEKLLEWYSKIHNINFAALRYFNAAGYSAGKCMEKNPGNLLPIIMEVASGRREILPIYGDDYETVDGTGVRDYIHVIDLADAHIKAMDFISTGENLIVNLSTGTGHSVMEIVYQCRELLNKDIDCVVAPRRSGDPGTVVASPQLAKNILDWEPKNSSMENILKSMWEIYKK